MANLSLKLEQILSRYNKLYIHLAQKLDANYNFFYHLGPEVHTLRHEMIRQMNVLGECHAHTVVIFPNYIPVNLASLELERPPSSYECQFQEEHPH